MWHLNNATRPHVLPQHLVFWTSSTRHFQLGNATSQQSDEIWHSEKAPLCFTIVNAKFESVSSILLNSDGPDWIDRGKHEFILVSEAQCLGLDDEPQHIGDIPYYVVMVVERDPETDVAFRLGLGRLEKTAWMLARPELKLVCLG